MMDTNLEDGPVEFSDSVNNSILLYRHKGFLYPRFFGDHATRFKKLNEFKTRPSDVFICGYPKSGTNWVWEIVNMLLSGKTEHVERSKMALMMEYKDLNELEEEPSPRILNTHLLMARLPPDIYKHNCRIIYLLRNPKDVCVSHFHHVMGLSNVYQYHGDWQNFLPLWLDGKVDYGSWFTFVKHWQDEMRKRPDQAIHVIHYENLKLNFLEECKRLAKYLNVSHGDEFYERVSQLCHIDVMKIAKVKSFTEMETLAWKDNKPKFFRKGIIGDWKNHFTVTQDDAFNTTMENHLGGLGLNFTFES